MRRDYKKECSRLILREIKNCKPQLFFALGLLLLLLSKIDGCQLLLRSSTFAETVLKNVSSHEGQAARQLTHVTRIFISNRTGTSYASNCSKIVKEKPKNETSFYERNIDTA